MDAELDITWGRAFRVWWALLWRGSLAFMASILMGALGGGLLGTALGSLDFDIILIKNLAGILGFLIGLAFSIIPVKLVLGKSFSSFRLVLVPKNHC